MEIFVGSYTHAIAGMQGRGHGIYSVSFDSASGAFGTPVLRASCTNPSSLAMTADRRFLFAGREIFSQDGPAVSCFRVGPECELTEISRQPLDGELPCHLAYDAVHSRLASAQYWTGDVALCTVDNGAFSADPQYFRRQGTGPNTARQDGPHAHFSAFTDSGTVLHLVDLGTDQIVSHRLGEDGRALEALVTRLPPGCGPRHMAITRDGTRAFLLSELDESLTSLARDGLGWRIIDIRQGFALASGEDGAAAAIRLSPDERHLYISSRRLSAIAGFALRDTPVRRFETGSGGETPRDFIITSDGEWLVVANQDSNTLTSLRRDTESGTLRIASHSCFIGSPASLLEPGAIASAN